MTNDKPSIGQLRLNDLVAGHPLALQRLREYEAVIDAAVAIYKSGAGYVELANALRKGGWL